MAVQDYKINYKSDFVLNINGDAGWAIPFCIKFWTGAPVQAYFVGFDGVKYVNCKVGDTPTQLLVMFDDHHLPIGKLKMQIAYHTTIAEFPGSVFDEVTNARDVIVTIDGTDYQVMLDFTGEDAPELEFNLPAYANEAERIQNELQRQQNEAARIEAELEREQASAAAVAGAENVNAQLSGNILTVTNRNGVSTSVNTKGEQGEQGPVGPEGPQGETGISIIDFSPKSQTETTLIYTVTFSDGHTQEVAIPKGQKGDTGATGPTGPQGQQGDTGVSITGMVKTGETSTDTLYNITFSNGTTQQVAIPKGEKGDQGPVGPEGPQGPMGDVAVITPEQQAAFTMYSVPGQNTDGPMTQKAVTDALSNNVNLNARIGLAQGSTSTVDGAIVNTTANRVYTYDKLFGKGTFHVKTNSGFIIRNILIYNSDNTFNKTYFNGDGLEVADMYITVEEGKYARVSFCKTDTSASILPTDNIISQCKFVPVGDKLDAVGDVVLKSVSIPFIDGYTIRLQDGVVQQESTNSITHLIKIDEYKAVYFTGKSGGVTCWFYDEDMVPITDAKISIPNLMVRDMELLQYAPVNAVYVRVCSRNLSASNPPSVYPLAYGLQKALTKEKTVDALKNGVQAYYDMSCLAFYDNGVYRPFTTTNTSIPIDFSQLEHLYYTGSMGGEVANWFDEDGEWIGSNVNANGNTIVNIDILPYAIEGAKYVALTSRNSSHSTPPSVTPNITAYMYSRDMSADSLFERFNVPTDGVTDATTALQNVIGASGEVVNFKPGTYVISSPLQINTAVVKVLNGNNAILKVSGDVAAINMYGTCTTNTASPATLTEAQKLEASTIIRELRITSSNLNQGEGIVITNTFQPVIEKCFIYNIKNGIVFRGRNRNGIIEGNNIWYCYNAGLLIDSGMNMHQCNIYGNHISYCQKCVHVNNPMQLANFQFVGNDIEIAEVPEYDLTDTRCIVFNYSATQYALCSEFEFSGNTIQGHNHSDSLIEFHGNSTIKIENVSFAGNQISNCNGNAIELSHVHNFAFCGNTYRLVYGKVFNLSKTIDGLTISNEVCESGSTGFMGCESDAVLNAVTLNGCTGRGMTGGIILSATTINGLSICCNNIASSNVTVSANTIDYVNVFGNMCRGTYNIGTCTHSNIGNNI